MALRLTQRLVREPALLTHLREVGDLAMTILDRPRGEILSRLSADDKALITLYETLDYAIRVGYSADLPPGERPR